MELKLGKNSAFTKLDVYSNRTIMELKFNWAKRMTMYPENSNRTIMVRKAEQIEP